jgi:hypothetical protein
MSYMKNYKYMYMNVHFTDIVSTRCVNNLFLSFHLDYKLKKWHHLYSSIGK